MPAKKSKLNNPPIAPMEKPSNLWAQHGIEDVYFQRESQVNFWTVMGGLQVAALLTQTSNLWEQLQAGRWHLALFLLDSLLVIGLVWALSSWGSLVLKWSISIPTILTQLLSNFALAVTCLLIVNPAGWFLALGISAIGNWIHQFIFSKSGAWEPYSAETIRGLKFNLLIYFLWPILCFAAAAHLFLAPSVVAETLWGVVMLAVIINALVRQHNGMQREKKEFGIP